MRINSVDDLKSFNFTEIALDFETEEVSTSGTLFSDPENDGKKMVLFSIALYEGKTLHSGVFTAEKFDDYWEIIKDKILIFHNAKFDIQVLLLLGKDIHNITFEDTMVMAHLLDETRRKALKELRVSVLGKQERSKYAQIDKNNAGEFSDYAIADAEDTIDLYYVFKPLMEQQKLLNVYLLEKMVIYPTIEMEQTGVCIDTDLLLYQEGRLVQVIQELNDQVTIMAGGIEVNINSPNQMNWFLYEHLAYPTHWLKKGANGLFSTGEPVLNEIAKNPHTPAGQASLVVLELRGYRKLLSTYNQPLFTKLKNGRIHSSFNPVGTVTGRYSSSNINMQNIPALPFDYERDSNKNFILDKKGKKIPDMRTHIRSLFVAGKGKVLIAADYSQVELRMMAELSQDAIMCASYLAGADIHQTTADSLGIARQDAKAVNFGIGYGLQSQGLMAQINHGREKGNYLLAYQAQEYIDNFWLTYCEVDKMFRDTEERVRKLGYVRTLAGRKRRFFEMKPADFREAKNTLIQGSSADLVKLAMIYCYMHLDHKRAKFIIQVHDEIILEADEDYADTAVNIVKKCMENCIKFSIPFIAEPRVVKVWSDAKG